MKTIFSQHSVGTPAPVHMGSAPTHSRLPTIHDICQQTQRSPSNASSIPHLDSLNKSEGRRVIMLPMADQPPVVSNDDYDTWHRKLLRLRTMLKKNPRRSGIWNKAEEMYLVKIIAAYRAGILILHPRVSLREYTRGQLHCSLARISKKVLLTQRGMLGHTLTVKNRPTPKSFREQIAGRKDLYGAEMDFLKAVAIRVELRRKFLK